MVCNGPLAYCYFRTFLDILFQVLILAIVARVALSWLTLAFPIRPGNPFYPLAVIIPQVTEPILAPMRRFLMIGMIYERYHTRSMKELGGLGSRMPVWATFMVFFTMASVGLPGLNGFVSEFLCIFGTFQAGHFDAPNPGQTAGPLGA